MLWRAGKGEEIASNTVIANALIVEIDESENRAGQRDDSVASGRGERRKDAQEVGEQDKDGDRTSEGDELVRLVAGVLFEQILDAETERIREKQFGSLLEGAGTLDGKAGAQEQGKDGADDEHEKGHNDVLGNGPLEVARLKIQGMKQTKGQGPEKVVKPLRDPAYMFFHSSIR
jgi:hypothetical protein